ncbi:peptidoglycan-associated lipoprotein Pal [Paracoccus sp. TK19116]|uniref:Peptidoglycan-associated lipoprotein n=1 Tax=Paracoccus albicereus TaxID=2922394 RepID=A0ABT1MQH5_9RHOB|nr:peptidoglycan-associated lipoprotein Pal [Paracoccus albicereus]MCQ0970547.1 peptidoglycan-associated lipoprotein Pal [Paracoccus albicereus]
MITRHGRAATLALLLAAGGLSACAPTQQLPRQVSDPYANAGGVAIYQGNLPGGSLGGSASAEYFRTVVGDTVLFTADQTTLSAEARTRLAAQAQWLINNTAFNARVEGHADEKGTREYNLALGARRASAVQEYLVAQGVEAGRIRTNTFGKERPLEVCSTEVCFAQNRRAQTIVEPAAGAAPPVPDATTPGAGV